MEGNVAKNIIDQLLQPTGIKINGDQPWDVKINNEQVFSRIINDGVLGLGEAYMEKWWDCPALDEFFCRTVRADLEKKIKMKNWLLIKLLFAKFANFESKKTALVVGKQHYDLGNLLFENMLDHRMNYTCGYWKNATTLEEAQLAKLELVCQKLMLKPGMRVLDIGCGWGALAKHAAENYGVKVVGITISKEQMEYAQRNCAGLPIEIRFQDYRDVNENFDRIVSLGMFEHVGHLQHRTYFEIAHRCLADDGIFLLHCIGANTTYFRSNDWINKYIFPNGGLPSMFQISKATEGLFVMEDWHNFGADYDKTLMAWQKNFENNWETKLKSHYDERFYRMWNYYLLSCAGDFRARDMQLWQIVLSKKGIIGGYQAPR